jgi:hypothetical protein
MSEDSTMTLDLYSYGRAHRDAADDDGEPRELFVCDGCDCSATATDRAFVKTLGWRLRGVRDPSGHQRGFCPRCAHRLAA